MKIQYCSDLHLEFQDNKDFIKNHPLEPVGEILLLAGDILPFAMQQQPCDFIDYVADNFEAVYWIPGNHEYYNADVGKYISPLRETIRPNVFLINNHTVQYKHIQIVCSTLWSKISEENMWGIKRSINDFKMIKYYGGSFTPDDFNDLHHAAMNYLKSALQRKPVENTIVMTHYVPTLMNYPELYKDSDLTESFAIELYDFIFNSKVPYWISGHHHYNTPEFKIGETRMLTNQLGYVHYGEQAAFRVNAVIEI